MCLCSHPGVMHHMRLRIISDQLAAVQVAVLGVARPGAKLKLLVQALTSPSIAARDASQPAELIPEDLQAWACCLVLAACRSLAAAERSPLRCTAAQPMAAGSGQGLRFRV